MSAPRSVVGKYLPPPPPMPIPKDRAPATRVARAAPTSSSTLSGVCRSESSFENMGKLGEGTYGVVYAMKDPSSGELLAVKKIRMEKEKDGLPITALREIQILKSLSHPNIVALKEIIIGKDPGSLSLVFEFVEHDLAALLDTMKTPFSEAEVKCLVQQLLQAVDYLHRNFIMHRDLKLSNLLMNNHGQLKLADFGLARVYGDPIRPYTPRVVTLWYRAPELLLGVTTYTTAIDLWGVGCIFGELHLKAPLLPGMTELEQLRCMVKLLGCPNERIWPALATLPGKDIANYGEPYSNLVHRFPSLSPNGLKLLNELLTYDPERRITAREALEHPYWTSSPLPTKEEWMPTHSISYRRCGTSFVLPDSKKSQRGEVTADTQPVKRLLVDSVVISRSPIVTALRGMHLRSRDCFVSCTTEHTSLVQLPLERRSDRMSRMASLEAEAPERIPSKDHLPLSVVWCPLPVLTWFVPFIGHLGIVTSEGVIHDFVGPYSINKDRASMGFGKPTKYLPIKLNDIRNAPNGDRIKAWDTAIENASSEFCDRMHNICCNNCHDHVGHALNELDYAGSHTWGTTSLMIAMIFSGHYVSTSRFFMTNLPFIIILCIIIGITVGAKMGSD